MAFTENDDQVKGILSANKGWSSQQAVDWANRYYSPQQSQPGNQPPGTSSTQPAGQLASSIGQQAQNASTYSATPGAAPVQNTANQGTQDVVRNSWLTQATQGTTVDKNAPEFRQQADSFAAGQERARRTYETEQAERLSAKGLSNSGVMDIGRRAASERAGQATGAFEAQLVQRELTNRREEIKEALTGLRGLISADQASALQRELAQLDAAIKREGIAQTGALGSQELALKDKLGMGALNIDLLRAMLQNDQFNVDSGIRIGQLEAQYAPWR